MEGLVVNPNFWKGKKVFLTGHTGFKGAWLSIWLNQMGAVVTGYSLAPNTEPSLFIEAKVNTLVKSIIGDIRDRDRLRAALQESQAEIVLHLAAQPLVRYSYQNPLETYETNVMGTAHLLESVKATSSVRSVVVVTTDKCYENKEWDYGYREVDPLGGYDPYSSSKACTELVTSAYRNSYFNPKEYAKHGVALASARAGNVVGGGDWALDRLVPDIVTAFSKSKQVEIRSPHSIRPWQHVLEPLCGYLMLAERLYQKELEFASAFNFGPTDDDCQPVEILLEKLVKLWGGDASFYLSKGPHPHEATFLKLDSSRARNRLGWRPVWKIDQTLEKTVEWYKSFYDKKSSPLDVTRRQINEYLAARDRI